MCAKIRILALTNLYPTEDNPGDTPAIKDQLESLKQLGVKIDLFHIRRKKRINYLLAAWKMFLQNFRHLQYDIIHAYYGHSGIVALCQIRYPVVITYLGSDILDKREKYLGRISTRFARAIIVMSEEMKQASGRQDAYVIPTGINPKVFQPISQKYARQRAGLTENGKLVLFPWNPARPVKRFDIVSKSIGILQEKWENLQLIAVFQKSPQEVALIMNACDAMVLASDHEGSPVAVREAMACNLPIVSVNVGDVLEVTQGVAHCTITRRDPESIAAALDAILESGERSDGSRFIERDSAFASAKQVLEVYQDILQK